MKTHITNLYNFNTENALVQKQHRFANAGHSLGFLEMGIFTYPTETDTDQELSKRLDGIIAALEPEDVIFIQLPTQNGYNYEHHLVNKCKAYKNTKIVLILHDLLFLSDIADKEQQAQYLFLYKMADAIIVPTISDIKTAEKYGLSKVLSYNDILLNETGVLSDSAGYLSLYQSDFYIKKVLMDAIDTAFMEQNKLIQSAIHASQDEIHIGFGLHDKTGNYSVWVGVAMQSIIEHTNAPLCFHILHDTTLNEKNRNRLLQVGIQNNNRIQFHLLDETLFADNNAQMRNYTIGALFRIMLPELLQDLTKIIYLDADILANRDIKELWDTDIDNYCLAAVPDADVVSGLVRPIAVKRKEVDANRYFNSGVLYMNLDRIRARGNMCNEILNYLQKTKESDLPDQDALNAVYTEDTLLLDGSWNCFVRPLRYHGDKTLKNNLYHFVGTHVILYSLTAVDRLYHETTSHTPWGIEECRKQLNNSLIRTDIRLRHFEKLIFQISHSHKKYIFYGEETAAMKNMYQLLSIREGDYRILAEKVEETNCILPCKDIKALYEENDNFLVFVLPQADRGNAVKNLEQLGLKNEEDFFVIPCLLSHREGGYLF